MQRPTPPAADAPWARDRVSAARRLALVVALLVWGGADVAQAARRVVVMSFSGPRGGAAAASVRRALRGYRLMPAGAYARAARDGGHAAAARRFRLTAVVKGSITRRRGRWMLRVSVLSGTGGVRGRGTFRLRGARVDRRTARRVAASLRRWIRNCQAPGGPARRPPRRRRRPPPTPPPVQPPPVQPPPAPLPATPPGGQTGFDDGSDIEGGGAGTAASALPRRAKPKDPGGGDASLGFEVGTGGKRGARSDDEGDDEEDEGNGDERGDGRRRSVNARPPWESIFNVGVGVSVVRRSFAFNDQLANPKPVYATNPVVALYARGAFYPGALFTRSVLADFGIVAHYTRILGLKSEVQPNVWAESFAQTFEIGLRHRWNVMGKLKSPIVRSTLQFGNQQFLILTTNPPLPDISYNYLKLGAGVDWIYFATGDWQFGASLDAHYLYVFSSGPIENADSTGYGSSFTGAFDGSGGVFVRFMGFSFHVEGFYRRFFYIFDMDCKPSNCNLAGGALDIYGGVTGVLGYTF